MTIDAAQTAHDLINAPMGCAFMLVARRHDLPPADLAKPAISFEVAAAARRALDPWTGSQSASIAEVLEHGPSLLNDTLRLLEQENCSWWSSTVLGSQQLWLDGESTPRESADRSDSRKAAFEMQRPFGRISTSTLIADTTHRLVLLAHRIGDWEPRYPVVQRLVMPSASGRYLELLTAEHWHQLALSTKGDGEADGDGPNIRVEPAWDEVARAWDAVHLTFLGYLSALYRRWSSAGGVTELRTWDCEQTLWLDETSTSVEIPLRQEPEDIGELYSLGLRVQRAWRTPLRRRRS